MIEAKLSEKAIAVQETTIPTNATHYLNYIFIPYLEDTRLSCFDLLGVRIRPEQQVFDELLLAEELPGWCEWQGFVVAEVRGEKASRTLQKQYITFSSAHALP